MWHSLGYVQVSSSGTPVRATNNQADPRERVPCQTILFQQHPDNTGILYVCDREAASFSTGVGVVAIIPALSSNQAGKAISLPNASASIPNAPAPFNAVDFWIDSDTDNQKCLVSILR